MENITHHEPIQDVVSRMKKMAELLVPYTFPLVKFEEERDILCLKQNTVRVDGYQVVLCFSRAQYKKYWLDSLQIQSYCTPFLPFYLVCKLGQFFLGSENLAYIDFLKKDKKVYCWTIKIVDNQILHPGEKVKNVSFEGFDFCVLGPHSVNIF